MSEEKYILEVTPAQASVIKQACEMLARAGIGQIHYAIEDNAGHLPGFQGDRAVKSKEALKNVANLIGAPDSGFNFGPAIVSKTVPNTHRTAWDICEVVRHRLAWDESPEGGMGVNFNQPSGVGDGALPKIKKKI